MEKLMRMEHNLATGEITYVEMTEEEQAEHEKNARLNMEQIQRQEAAEAAKKAAQEAMPELIAQLQARIEELEARKR